MIHMSRENVERAIRYANVFTMQQERDIALTPWGTAEWKRYKQAEADEARRYADMLRNALELEKMNAA
jgi:hypothetical protein